jgi:hypothetical protein
MRHGQMSQGGNGAFYLPSCDLILVWAEKLLSPIVGGMALGTVPEYGSGSG